MKKINVAWDMETADPDDVFTLCLLSHHPLVNLVSVTVTPGSKYQIGLVKHILNLLGKDIPVGSKNKDHPKHCVSDFHYTWLGQIPPADPDSTGANILMDMASTYPDLTIICGASLGNIGALLDFDRIDLKKIVIQGGFAGDNIVSPENILEKFKGKTTCPTFNLNGDVPSAIKVLESSRIKERWFVSKNVCHGVKYDSDMHHFMEPYRHKNPGLELIYNGMTKYLCKRPDGKAFHDPLAACCAINPDICKFEDVEIYRHKGEWGSRKSDKINAKISVQVDMDKFRMTLVGE
jgi:inosine-uridine nucleoside N-ribohydrolase